MATPSQQPPPYGSPNQPPLQQQGQQYVHQYVQQNPHGFVQSQPPREGFSDISGGYGYNQPPHSPQPMVNTSSTSVVVSTRENKQYNMTENKMYQSINMHSFSWTESTSIQNI